MPARIQPDDGDRAAFRRGDDEADGVAWTKFVEWNWMGGATGQLGHRDTVVANICSLLDAAATGMPVP